MSSDEEVILVIAARRVANRRRAWIRNINQGRAQFGEFHHLYRELESEEDQFFRYFRMSPKMFDDLHNLVKSKITKNTTNWRRPISSKERLAVCLRFLATGVPTGLSHFPIESDIRLFLELSMKCVRQFGALFNLRICQHQQMKLGHCPRKGLEKFGVFQIALEP